jgi:hypothetical protein
MEKVRHDFNDAAGPVALRHAVRRRQRPGALPPARREIRSAADDLAKRTEQQAASVEETAAALEDRSPRPSPIPAAGRRRPVILVAATRANARNGPARSCATPSPRWVQIEHIVTARFPTLSASSTKSPSRPTSWRSMPALRPPAPARPARDSRSSPRRCANSPSGPPRRPRKSRR